MKGIREEEFDYKRTSKEENETLVSENTIEKSVSFFENGIAQKWLNTNEAASYLRISTNALRILVHKRKVEFYKYGRLLRFKRDDLHRVLQKGV